jgi:hypothetical protein
MGTIDDRPRSDGDSRNSKYNWIERGDDTMSKRATVVARHKENENRSTMISRTEHPIGAG